MTTASVSRSRLPVRALVVGAVALVATASVFAFRRQTAAASGVALAKENLAARGEACSSRNITGTGVLMEVFSASGNSAAAVASGLVPVLDVNTAPGAVPRAGQTVRWSGWVKAKSSGSHRFQLPTGVQGAFHPQPNYARRGWRTGGRFRASRSDGQSLLPVHARNRRRFGSAERGNMAAVLGSPRPRPRASDARVALRRPTPRSRRLPPGRRQRTAVTDRAMSA